MEMALSKELLIEHVQLILFFGILGFLANWIAKSRGFFVFPRTHEEISSKLVTGKQVISAFAIYLVGSFILFPVFNRLFLAFSAANPLPLSMTGLLQLLTLASILFFLTLFSLKQERGAMKKMWLDEKGESFNKLGFDFLFGACTWLIAFPTVMAIGQICDFLLYIFFHVESYEQVAVRFLKEAFASPFLLITALFTIMVIAPVIEEWLFRGFLQSFFRKQVGKKGAIMLSSLCFALFHLSLSQGWGNVSIAVSLFTFASYLGFIYERQGTLFAPIGLHIAFNTVSSLRILLTPDM